VSGELSDSQAEPSVVELDRGELLSSVLGAVDETWEMFSAGVPEGVGILSASFGSVCKQLDPVPGKPSSECSVSEHVAESTLECFEGFEDQQSICDMDEYRRGQLAAWCHSVGEQSIQHSPNRAQTRSMGAVMDLPHVQPAILEYR
jgi:hypothetical protein